MITGTYTCSKALAERAHRNSIGRWRHLWQNFIHYLWRFVLLGLLVLQADNLFGNDIAWPLVVVPVLLCAALFAVEARRDWLRSVQDAARDSIVEIEMDEAGVRSRYQEEPLAVSWDHYVWYEDEPEVTTFMHRDGTISYVPRNDATAALLAFARSRIRPRHPAQDP